MMLEPGRIEYLRAGEEVTFADPPNVADNDAFSRTQHHAIAVELGVPYSDLTGDYREATFASLRIERLAHWGDVTTWQDDIIVPGLCDPIWKWFAFAYSVRSVEAVEWFGPVMPSIDPEKEGLAVTRLIRSGMMTPDDAVESRGKDPDTHWPAYARALQRLDDLGIVLDSDPRKTTLNGQAQDTEEPKMAESDA
jgi:capsid protein